jgi:CheY-like chemotaxis protein
MATRVLVVEDDASIREMIALALESAGHEAVTASNGEDALELVEHEEADVIVLDLRMPLMDGSEFARRYDQRDGRAPIIVLTATGSSAAARAVIGAVRVVEKPFDVDQLLGAVKEAERIARDRV